MVGLRNDIHWECRQFKFTHVRWKLTALHFCKKPFSINFSYVEVNKGIMEVLVDDCANL